MKTIIIILTLASLAVIGVFIYNQAVAPNDLIEVIYPQPNDEIYSSLNFRGRARGYWFFEASAPVRVYDANGRELGVGLAIAEGEWMIEDFVPFSGTVEFAKPVTRTGKIVFQKDNPSGLPENDKSLEIPIRFK